MPVQHSFRVQEHLVGHTTDIIGSLCETVAISHNPFAALLEVQQGLADGMSRGRGVRTEGASLNVYTFNVLVLLSLTDGSQDVVQSQVV